MACMNCGLSLINCSPFNRTTDFPGATVLMQQGCVTVTLECRMERVLTQYIEDNQYLRIKAKEIKFDCLNYWASPRLYLKIEYTNQYLKYFTVKISSKLLFAQ